MTPALQNRVQRVALTARRLVRLHGIGWFFACCCAMALGIGWLDYLLRFQDSGVRWIVSVTALVLVVWCFGRFVFPAFRYRCSDLQAACRIEERFPELGDRLSSAVAFAANREEDPRAGSSQLRRSVIVEAEAALQQLNVLDCLDSKLTRRAIVAGLMGCAAIVALACWDGRSVALAARRIVSPWSDEQWPRRHVLRFVTPPRRLARGQDFEIEVVDIRGEPPERVEIHYWFDGETEAEIQTFEMQPFGAKLAHRLSNVANSFRYRATGGDDQRMDWMRLEVLQPPQITEHDIELIPPDYTGQVPYVSDGPIRALVGSRAAVRIRVDKRLSQATLLTDTMSGLQEMPLELDADQKGFHLSAELPSAWTIRQSGDYSFRMIDVEGLQSGADRSWDVSAVTDQPPTVSFTTPTANLFVTARAKIPIQLQVKDDFAIQKVELRYSRSDQSAAGEQAVTLMKGDTRAPRREISPANSVTASGIEETVAHTFDLQSLPALEPGDWLDLTAVVLDYQDELGTTAARRLTLISEEQLEDRLSQRQTDILTQISEVAQLQRQTRSQVAGMQIQLEELEQLSRKDLDRLQSIELNQRQVSHRVGHPEDGVLAQIAELLAELEMNRVDNTEVSRRMTQVAKVISELMDDSLPVVQQEIVEALKLAREDLAERADDAGASSEVRGQVNVAMRNAHAGQDRVVESLERLLGELSEWDSYRQLAREVGRLRREQEETRRQTEQLRLDTLTQNPEKLGSTQRAELRRLTERQRELSRSFDRLQSRMTEMRARLEDNEPLAAATLRDALDAAQRMTLGSKLRDAGDQLRVNRLGQAAERQSEIVNGLTKLQDLLANRRENTLDRVVGELRAAAAELSDLEKQQDKVRQDLDDPENHTAQALRELADKERDLAEQLQRLANRLEQLRAGQAGDLLQKATGALEKASTAAEGGDVADSKRNADLAANRMLQAQQQLQRSLGQTQQDLLREQLVRYRQLLAGVLQGQQNVLKSTLQLDDERATLANAEKPQWEADAMQLADDELGLQRIVASLVGQVTEVRVLQVVLSDVSDSMADVERNLRQWRTDSSTQSILRATIAQLEQVMAALEVARDAAGAGQQGTPQQVGSQAQNAFLVAQLKMLRDLQSSINVGTRQLDQLREQGRPLTEIQQQRHRDLANRQGDVARLLAELLIQAGVEATKEDAPDNRLDRLDQILDFD